MIKSCFLCVEGKIFADYFNSQESSSLQGKAKEVHQFLLQSLEYNLINKKYSPHLECEVFYFCFYHNETFTLIFEVDQNRKDLKEILYSISQDLKKTVVQKYYTELQKGTVTSSFTFQLRNLLSQYESVVSREKTIEKIQKGL